MQQTRPSSHNAATLAAATAAEQERQWDAFTASLGLDPSAPAPSRPPVNAYAAHTPPSEAAWDAFTASLGIR